jgi:hypothetical protein
MMIRRAARMKREMRNSGGRRRKARRAKRRTMSMETGTSK